MANRLPHDLYPIAPGDAPEQHSDRLQLLTNIVQQSVAHVEDSSLAAAPTTTTNAANTTTEFDRAAGGPYEHNARTTDSSDPLEYIDPKEWTYCASRTFALYLPPSGTSAPCLWNPRYDEAEKIFTETARISPRDEYRHMLCYGVFMSAVNAALENGMEPIRLIISTLDEKAYAYTPSSAQRLVFAKECL
jgi:hypothetical protein